MNTQSEAKRFFATKVIDRARTEGVALSDAERRTLYWSESDPEFKADPKLVEQLASEMSDEDYEAKTATLLQSAFAADSATDSRAREVWQQAPAYSRAPQRSARPTMPGRAIPVPRRRIS